MDLIIQKDCHQRVHHLLAAERINMVRGQGLHVLDGGKLVPTDAFLHCTGFYGPYDVSQLLPEIGMVACCITVGAQVYYTFQPEGTFLFEALRDLGRPDGLLLKDSFGRPWKLDSRLGIALDFMVLQLLVLATQLMMASPWTLSHGFWVLRKTFMNEVCGFSKSCMWPSGNFMLWCSPTAPQSSHF